MGNFVPRYISSEMAAQGYNNEGRGKCLGYISNPMEHESACAYRKNPKRAPIPGEANAHTGVSCNCRIGLWQDPPKKAKPKKAATRKAKPKPKAATRRTPPKRRASARS